MGTCLSMRSVAAVVVIVAALCVVSVCGQVTRTVTFNGNFWDHPQDMMDMERPCGACTCGLGIVMDDIGPDRNPVYRGGSENSTLWNPQLRAWPRRGQYLPSNVLPPNTPNCEYTSNGGSRNPNGQFVTGKAHFDDWFRTSPKYSIPIPGQFIFNETSPGSGLFKFDRGSPQRFFPLNKRGWGDDDQNTGLTDNFYFCVAMHAEFLYNGTETFSFSGDDDVWVFVNGKLVVDIGGVHGSVFASVTLSTVAAKAGLVVGRRHTFDFFQCERHLTESNSLITTSIVPVNAPPTAADMTYTISPGQSVSDVFPAFDPDGDALTINVLNAAAVPTFSYTNAGFTFTAPSSQFAQVIQVVYTARDAEFTTCEARLTFEVSGLPPALVAPPPPPSQARSPSKPILSKTATIAIAVVGSVLVIAAIVGVIGIILYTRARWNAWEAEIHDALTKEGLLNNPLYEGGAEEQYNPMYEQ